MEGDPETVSRFQVRNRMIIHRLFDIDLKAQTFSADWQLESSWMDPKIKSELEKHKTQIVPNDEKSSQLNGLLFLKPADVLWGKRAILCFL